VEELRAKGVDAQLYGETATETYTQLQSFYLLVDRPEVYGLPKQPVNPWVHMRGDYLRACGMGLIGVVLLLAVFLFHGN
jgi:formate dehydrogenase iron-sulfur subunit